MYKNIHWMGAGLVKQSVKKGSICLEEALLIVREHDKGYEPSTVYELEDSWIISLREPQSKEEPDVSPYRVYKEGGKIEVFFPPDYPAAFLNGAKEIL